MATPVKQTPILEIVADNDAEQKRRNRERQRAYRQRRRNGVASARVHVDPTVAVILHDLGFLDWPDLGNAEAVGLAVERLLCELDTGPEALIRRMEIVLNLAFDVGGSS